MSVQIPGRWIVRLAIAVVLIPLPFVLAQDSEKTTKDLATFSGHQETVYGVALSGDGKQLLTASFDRTIKLWDTTTRQELRTFAGPTAHQGLVLGVAFAPDGQTFASCSSDSTVKIWDVPLRKPLRDLAMTSEITAAAMSTDGKSAAVAGKDGSIRIWNSAEPKETFRCVGHVGAVTGLAYSANGQMLASVGVDGTLRYWNPVNGQGIAVVGAHPSAIHALAVATNGNAVYTAGNDGSVKIWQLPPVASKPLAGHQDAVRAMSMSNDGNTVATGGNDKVARLFNTDSGQLQRVMTAPSEITSIATGGAGATATTVAGTADGQLMVWGSDGKPLLQVRAGQSAVTGVQFAPNGNQLLTSCADGTITTWALPVVASKTIAQAAAVRCSTVSADGKRILTGNADNHVRLWTAANAQMERDFAGLTGVPIAVAMTGDAGMVGGASATEVRIWRRDNGQPAGTLSGMAGITSIAFHPNGNQLLVGQDDGSLKLWALPIAAKDAKPVWAAKCPVPVRKLIFEPKGSLVLTGKDGSVRFWDAKVGKELKSVAAHDGEILDTALTGDGLRLVTAGADQKLKTWSVPDGNAVGTIPLTVRAVRLAASPNGSRMAIASEVGKGMSVTVMNSAGRTLMTMDGPFSSIVSLHLGADPRSLVIGSEKDVTVADIPVQSSFATQTGGIGNAVYAGNGTQVLTGGKDKTVKLWDIATGKELKSFGPAPEAVSALAISRDSNYLAVACGKSVKIWTANDGKEVATLTHPAQVISLGFSADRSKLITGTTDNLARVWDLAPTTQGKPAVEMQSIGHGAAVNAVAFHPGKPNIAVTASDDKTASIHSLSLQRTMAASTMPIRAMTLSPSGQVVVAGDDMTVRAITPGNEAAARTFAGATSGLLAVAVSRNGTLLASSGNDKVVRIYNFNDGNLLGSFSTPNVARSLGFHSNNLALLTAGADRVVTAWNIVVQPGNPPPPEFGKPVQTFAHTADAQTAAYSSDGTMLISGGDDKSAHIWKVAADGPIRNFQHGNIVDSIAYNQEGTQLASGSHDGTIRIFDLVKGAQLRQITAHVQTQPQNQQFPVYSVAWSPNSKWIASGSLDRNIKIWDAMTGTIVREIKGYDEKLAPHGHRDGVFSVAFSPDGQWLISGSSDRSIKVWKTSDGSFVRDFVNPGLPSSAGQPAMAHPGWVYQLRYSPDGASVVSVGGAPKNQGFVGVWNPGDGKLLASANLNLGPIYGFAMAPDGASMALACGPRTRLNPQADAVIIKTPGK